MFSNGSTSLGRISRSLLLILSSLFVLGGLILLTPPGSYAAQVTLAWDPETDPNVAGYKVYYGTASRSYQYNNDAGKTATSTVSNLQTGTTYYFAVTAYNATGIESGYSAEVSYAATTCQYTLSPTSQSILASGGSASTGISTQSGCPWTAVSNAPSWISIPSTSSGTGSGTVSYLVAANSATTSRSGTMTIGGQTFTVNQAGSVQYTITASTADSNGSISPVGTVTVNSGANQTFTISPKTGYQISDVKVDGASKGAVTSYSFNNVTASHTIQASFKLPSYTITATTADSNGTISPVGAVTVNSGANQTFTITPKTGYQISDVKVDGASKGAVTSYSFNNVTASHTIQASFKLPAYTITATTADSNGSISPVGTVTVNSGANQSFTITPNSGYQVADVKVDGNSVGAPPSYLFGSVVANHTIQASFKLLNTYTITASTADSNGSISPVGAVTVNSGASQTFTITPKTGYQISDVKVDSASVGAVTSYSFSNVTANRSIQASFKLPTYTITASTADSNGSISPVGAVTVNSGASQTFTITPKTGYQIADVKVDSASVGAVTSYSFSNVTANRSIQASFKLPNTYTLSVAKSGTGTGTVSNSPVGPSFDAGTVVTLTAAPDPSSNFFAWSGACTGSSSTCTVTMNNSTSVTATFNLKTYTITASADANGSISPQGTVTVNHGANQNFANKPNTGYQISDVKADGTSAGAVSSYTFGNVMSNHTIQTNFSPANPAPGKVVAAMNTGGPQYSSKTGITYVADKYYSGGSTWRIWRDIAGTDDDRLYQSERYGNFSYSLSVPNGNYTVTLKFAEIYWSGAGHRIFNVNIGGTQVISKLDIFAKVGKNRAYDVTIPVTVVNGILKIDFVTVVDNAKVSAILVQTR